MREKEFDKMWDKIVYHAGEIFYTKTGVEFKYSVKSNAVVTNRTNYKLYRSDFKKAFELMPIDGPGKINDIVREPAYIWAILNDKRINMDQ